VNHIFGTENRAQQTQISKRNLGLAAAGHVRGKFFTFSPGMQILPTRCNAMQNIPPSLQAHGIRTWLARCVCKRVDAFLRERKQLQLDASRMQTKQFSPWPDCTQTGTKVQLQQQSLASSGDPSHPCDYASIETVKHST